jgi:hypothetical protein
MTLRVRNDPFSDPKGGDDQEEQSGTLITFARILAFLFAAVLSWILYRVISGAWRQYQQHGAYSLFDRRRGTYRRIPSLRLQRPEEEGYRDEGEEPDVDAPVAGNRGKGKAVDVEVEDEGYHDGENSLDIARRNADLWKDLPERPLPDKPLPDVPRG